VTREEAVRLCARAHGAHSRTPSREALETWVAMLPAVDYPLAERALWNLLESPLQRPPTLADLLRECATLRRPELGGSGEETWAVVLRAVRDQGVYRRPVFDDPLVAKAVEAVGWQAICNSTEQDVIRAHYCRAYRAIHTRELRESVSAVSASQRQLHARAVIVPLLEDIGRTQTEEA
jgi:O-acetyl-ADP-ribose deacetylase (regulator of RNase III)